MNDAARNQDSDARDSPQNEFSFDVIIFSEAIFFA